MSTKIIMSNLNIRIVTEIGENLNEQDWIDITNFVEDIRLCSLLFLRLVIG